MSPTDQPQWRKDRDVGQGKLSCLWFQSQAHHPGGCLEHHFGLILGKRDFAFSTLPQGACMPRNPMLPDCSQTRPTFKALILNECCVAGQVPQACLGARGGQDVHLEARQAHSAIQAMRKQRENRTQRERGPVSQYLSWLGGHCQCGAYQSEVETIKPKATPSFFYLPKGTLSFSLLLYASLFSHHLFSLKG